MDGKTFAAAAALMISVICASVTQTARDCREIRENMLRMHILANSDSEYDQSLKLAVRDELLEHSDEIFAGCRTEKEAEDAARRKGDFITETARGVLADHGCDLPVSCGIESVYFDERSYGDITLPQGEYRALRVEIGDAAGHNWWCVMFPPLCVPCCSDEKSTDEILDGCGISEEETDIMENIGEYEVRLYIVRLIESIFGGK